MSQNKVPYDLVYRDEERAALAERFGSKYKHFMVFDDEEYFFHRPAEIEFDVVEKNGTVILFEISFWIYKAGVYTLLRKAEWYKEKYNVDADRKIVIDPAQENLITFRYQDELRCFLPILPRRPLPN